MVAEVMSLQILEISSVPSFWAGNWADSALSLQDLTYAEPDQLKLTFLTPGSDL